MTYFIIFVCLALSVVVGFVVYGLFRVGHRKYIQLRDSTDGANRLRTLIYLVPAVFLGVLSLPVFFYIANFRESDIASSAAEWGQFGDYIGGLLNPIFGFSSLLALLYTIRIQSKELSLTRAGDGILNFFHKK